MNRILFFFVACVFLAHCKPESGKILLQQNSAPDGTLIAFGSCNKHQLDQSYWKQIAAHHPAIWIWLGDIVYADTKDMGKLNSMYNEQKANPYYQSFSDSCRIIGMWDDHDYGLNDGGKEFEERIASKRALYEFLDIPDNDPSRFHEGVYQSYLIRENGISIKLILLDTRYFRGALVPDPSGKKRYLEASQESILGDEQWAWFEEELKNSTADFHLIGSGIQIIPVEHGFEKWENFPSERQKFLRLLEKYDPQGTILISGDRHIAEISQYSVQMSQDRLTEVTSSGLTHSYEQTSSEKEPNSFRLGELYPEKNYGLLYFQNGREKSIDIQLWGMEDNLLVEHKLVFSFN